MRAIDARAEPAYRSSASRSERGFFACEEASRERLWKCWLERTTARAALRLISVGIMKLDTITWIFTNWCPRIHWFWRAKVMKSRHRSVRGCLTLLSRLTLLWPTKLA